MTIESQIAAFFAVDRALHATPLTVACALHATPLETPEYRPSPAEIVEVLMEHFDEASEVVIDWLMTAKFSEVE